MNTSAMEWGLSVLTPEVVTGKKVLEVGSYDFNGSLQTHVKALSPQEFIGIDSVDGPGVDVVLDAKDLLDTYGHERWDLVLSTEMLEHCEGWQDALYQMKASIAVGGWLFITTRSPGFPYHGYPDDFWRFTPEVMTEALGDLGNLEVSDDPGHSFWVNGREVYEMGCGVFAKGQRSGSVSRPSVEAEKVHPPQFRFSPTRIWPPSERMET